jgi:hypothetical protein
VIPDTAPKHYLYHHFFISYASQNSNDAQKLSDCLQQIGLRVFLDRDRRRWHKAGVRPDDPRGEPISGPDEEIGRILAEDLSGSESLLVIATAASYQSAWVAREFQHFFEQQRPIIVWHPDGDFWNDRAHDPRVHPLSRRLFRAMTGDEEIPWILQHLPEGRNDVLLATQRIALWQELLGFACWHGFPLTCNGVEAHRVDRVRTILIIMALREEIRQKYAKSVCLFRDPSPSYAASRRQAGRHKPWRVREVDQMQQVLENAAFRKRIFGGLPSEDEAPQYEALWTFFR